MGKIPGGLKHQTICLRLMIAVMKNDLHQLLSLRVSRISFFASLEFQRGPVGGLLVTYGSPLSILIFEYHVAGDP